MLNKFITNIGAYRSIILQCIRKKSNTVTMISRKMFSTFFLKIYFGDVSLSLPSLFVYKALQSFARLKIQKAAIDSTLKLLHILRKYC